MFTEKLRSLDYTEASLCQLLGVRDLPLIDPQDLPSYLQRLQQENGALALAAAFWLLHQPVREAQLIELHGHEQVRQLKRWGLLKDSERGGGIVEATADLYPCLDDYLFTDSHLALRYQPEHVYQLGTDSYVLARVTARAATPRGRALDLCTGSGVHAIQSARFYGQSVGVDINPRALQFAQRNAELNGVAERCSFFHGDLYAPVEGLKFDLITINPPFVPTPDEDMHVHRTGGESGEIISERAVAGLPEFLAEGGTFSMILDFPVMRSSSYLERLCGWLGSDGGPAPGWGVAVLNFGHVPVERYVKDHVDPSDINAFHRMYMRYLESYQRQGIEQVGFANVFIRRLPAGHPGFAAEHVMAYPCRPIQPLVEAWLRALTRYCRPQGDWEPDWEHDKPRVSPWVKDLWLNHRGDRGMVEFADAAWTGPVQVPGDLVRFLKLINGRSTAEDLARRWANKNHLSAPESREQVRHGLAALGTWLLID